MLLLLPLRSHLNGLPDHDTEAFEHERNPGLLDLHEIKRLFLDQKHVLFSSFEVAESELQMEAIALGYHRTPHLMFQMILSETRTWSLVQDLLSSVKIGP